MIKARFYGEHSGQGDTKIKGFIVMGHAGYDEYGRDLVCASVSAVVQTALLGLGNYLSKEPVWKMNADGFVECWIPEGLSPEEEEKAQVILHTLEIGLLSIEESYGSYLKVSKRRWTK